MSNNTFEIKPLPDLAQISPVFGIIASDFDQDGNLDIITGGNLFGTLLIGSLRCIQRRVF